MQPRNPIEHVVIIVKENHTFDNYFGTFPGATGDATLAHAPDPPANDPPHDHAAWLNRARGAVRQQYHESDIAAYFSYARQFTLCDNYFTEVASQSEPNHLMLIAADSPIIDNASPRRTYQPQPPFSLPNLPDALARAGLTWKSYGDPALNYFNQIASLKGSPNIVAWTQFDADVASGKLSNVSWVYAPPEFSEHPPSGGRAAKPVVAPGMQWTVDRVTLIGKSKLWASTVVFITWDDWGGWYDHIDAPLKDIWKNGGPAGAPYANSQFSYGPRVPCLVLSPYAKKGNISKAFHSHVSIVKFCETTFGLPALNARDTSSDDMSDCFNFQQTPLPPPTPAPVPTPPPGPKPKPKPKPRPKPKPKPRKTSKRTQKTAKRTRARARSTSRRAL